METVERIKDYMTPGEDRVTEMIEARTAQIPSVAFLIFSLAAMGTSLALLLTGRRQLATFIGQWVPTVLIMGLYNKTVKQQGSD